MTAPRSLEPIDAYVELLETCISRGQLSGSSGDWHALREQARAVRAQIASTSDDPEFLYRESLQIIVELFRERFRPEVRQGLLAALDRSSAARDREQPDLWVGLREDPPSATNAVDPDVGTRDTDALVAELSLIRNVQLFLETGAFARVRDALRDLEILVRTTSTPIPILGVIFWRVTWMQVIDAVKEVIGRAGYFWVSKVLRAEVDIRDGLHTLARKGSVRGRWWDDIEVPIYPDVLPLLQSPSQSIPTIEGRPAEGSTDETDVDIDEDRGQ